CLQVAAVCQFPTLYLTCEMRPRELLRRVAARVTGTFLGKLKSGEMTGPQVRAHLERAAAAAPLLTLADATQAYARPQWLRQGASVVKGEARHLLIVVDSVHSWMEGDGIDASEYDRLNGAISSLRAIASALECPIIAIAERNRGSMATGGMSA